MGPFALLPAVHQSGIAQYLHMIGQSGLSEIQRLLKLAGTFLSGAQLLQNRQALGIAQRFEYFRVLLMLSHALTSNQIILMYQSIGHHWPFVKGFSQKRTGGMLCRSLLPLNSLSQWRQ